MTYYLPPTAGGPAPMNWYHVPSSGDVRWWDGTHWATYRLTARGPKAAWYATEPPTVGFIFGPIFMLLGFAQFALSLNLEHGFTVGAGSVLMLFGVFFLLCALLTARVRALPAPFAEHLATDALAEPIPGRAEGPGAAWVALNPRVSRWWSGARWGHYVFENKRVRPTFGGERTYRTLIIMAIVMVGFGVLALLLGIFVVSFGVGRWATPIGVVSTITGVTFAIVGAIIFPIANMRKASLVLPKSPPMLAAPPVLPVSSAGTYQIWQSPQQPPTPPPS